MGETIRFVAATISDRQSAIRNARLPRNARVRALTIMAVDYSIDVSTRSEPG